MLHRVRIRHDPHSYFIPTRRIVQPHHPPTPPGVLPSLPPYSISLCVRPCIVVCSERFAWSLPPPLRWSLFIFFNKTSVWLGPRPHYGAYLTPSVQVFSTAYIRAIGTMCITPLFSYTQQTMHRQCITYSHIDSTVPSRDSSLSPSFDSATSTTLVSESLPHILFSGWNTSCQPYAGIRMEGMDDWLGASVPSHGSSLPWYYVSGAMAYNGCQLSGDMAHDSFTTRFES